MTEILTLLEQQRQEIIKLSYKIAELEAAADINIELLAKQELRIAVLESQLKEKNNGNLV